ncbi:MAG: hypothetical protein HZA92_06230 [Verrucomicrobia bacterium]|nr:hypothetical protein [Verrucomicrobiota bacterium]
MKAGKVISNQCLVRNRPSDARPRPFQTANHSSLITNYFFLLAALLLTALPLRAQHAVDVLQLLDGSSLHGVLEAIGEAKGIRWKHPASAAPIEFLPRNAHQIRFAQVAPPLAQSSAHQTCRFRFLNGDELTGNLLSLDATHIELETWFAGKLRAPRAGVQSLAFLARGFATIYDGPTGLGGWSTGPTPAAWQLRDGVLTGGANAFMGRDLKLPPQSRIEFEVGAAAALNLYVSLYTDSTERFNFASSGYQFHLGPGYVNLMRGQGQFGMQHLGQAQIPVPIPGRKLRVEIRADLLASAVTLLVDGNVIQQWNDPSVAKPAVPALDPNLPPFVAEAVRDAARARGPSLPGTGISFFMLNGGIDLSGIKVSAWDGRPIEPEAVATNFTGHLVRLANQDRALGEVRAIRDGKLTLAATAGSLEIPLTRVTHVILAAIAPPATNRPAGEMHARLSSGETLALTQPRWDGRQLAGMSPHFGPLQLDTRWVRLLRFNPGREPVAPDLLFPGVDGQQFFER